MMIKATHLCRCGHQANSHTSGVFPCDHPDGVPLEVVQNNSYSNCGKCSSSGGTCKHFELPNLDLIEYLAEKRGLI